VNYKNLLLALGITISGSQLVESKGSSLIEDIGEVSSLTRRLPSPIFIEIDVVKDKALDDTNISCTVTNKGC